MRTILIAVLLLLTTTPALAEADWIKVSSTGHGAVTDYIDISSIRITGPIRSYWNRTDYVNDPKGLKKNISLFEANCASGQFRILQITAYKVDGTNSKPFTFPDRPWLYVTPDTEQAALQDYVCGK